MGNVHLVTGYAGQEHVTAADHAAFNAALIGTGQFVLDKGNVFEAQVISNNQIRVLDGELMMQGRFIRLNPDTYIDLNIDNGAQGMKRNDLIAVRYTKDTASGVESADLVVIKGTAVASSSVPADPAHTEGDITNGTSVRNDFPLWRIPLDGLNVGTPEMLFEPFSDSLRTLPWIRQQVLNIHAEVDKKIARIDSYLKIETLTDETKAKFGLGTDAVPNDVLGLIPGLIKARAQIATGSYIGTGTVASTDSPITLTFDFEPKAIVIIPDTAYIPSGNMRLIAIKPQTNAPVAGSFESTTNYRAKLAWDSNSVSIVGSTGPMGQSDLVGASMNQRTVTYYYLAIG